MSADDAVDFVRRYALSRDMEIGRRTVLVEGTSDVRLLQCAARLEREATGRQLLGTDFSVVAAGVGEQGGAGGVVRELMCFRGLGRTCLTPSGRPRYRFVGLVDNDRAGQDAVKWARRMDASLVEYMDLFRLWPAMPRPRNVAPESVRKVTEDENARHRGLEWELEDLLPRDFIGAFSADHEGAVTSRVGRGAEVHWEFTRDGKTRFHRFVEGNAMRVDVGRLVGVLESLRWYLGLDR